MTGNSPRRMGACIHAPWPWPRGDQKMRERHRQTATKPTYYIRGIEITAISGLGRIGAGVASPATSSTIIMSSTWASVVPAGTVPKDYPRHLDGLSGRPRASVSRRSPRSRAHRGHRAGFVEVGSGVDQGQRRPRAGHCRRLWERLWGGVSNWARTPTGF